MIFAGDFLKIENHKKYILTFSAFACAAFFASCKNAGETKLVYTESDTIKQAVLEKEQNITWTQELEGEVLTKKITRGSMQLGSDVAFNKELFKIASNQKKSVYPEYFDFGSLDTSLLQPKIKEKINQFCKKLSSVTSDASSYFNKKYIFNFVFFQNDLKEGWKTNFNQDFPKSSEESTVQLFEKWIFGEPFIGDLIIQLPVRFYTNCGIIDVTIFLNSGGNNDIYQITIDRWKKV